VISRHAITNACQLFALAISTLLVKCSSAIFKVLAIAVSMPDDLSIDSVSLPPTRATRKQRANYLGRCYQPERPFCTLARCTFRRRTAPFSYVRLSAQVCGWKTRVHGGCWHTGHCLYLTSLSWRILHYRNTIMGLLFNISAVRISSKKNLI
jgi:hypothetical protein